MSGYKRVNFYELCRLCSSNQQKEKTHIFHEEGQKKHLQAKIQSLFSLKICEDDFLPKVICSKCLESLEDCYTFRNDCISSESMLSSYFNNFRYTEDFTKSGKVYIKDTTPPKPEVIIPPIAPQPTTNIKPDIQDVNPIYIQYAENKPKIDTKNVPVTYNVIKQPKMNDMNNIMINSNGEIVNITYDFDSILNQNNILNKQPKIERPAKKKIKVENRPIETIVIDDYEKLPHIKRSNYNKIVYPIKSESKLQNIQQHILSSSHSIVNSLINNSNPNLNSGLTNSRISSNRISNTILPTSNSINSIIPNTNSMISHTNSHVSPTLSNSVVIPNSNSLITHTNSHVNTNSNINSLHSITNANSVVIPNTNSMISHANSHVNTIISNSSANSMISNQDSGIQNTNSIISHGNAQMNKILTNSNSVSANNGMISHVNSHVNNNINSILTNASVNSILSNPNVLTNSNIFTNSNINSILSNSILSNSNVITSANSIVTNANTLRNMTVPVSNVNANVVTSQSYVASGFNPQKLLESINNAQKIVDSISTSTANSNGQQQHCFFTNMNQLQHADNYEIQNGACTQNKMAQTDEVLDTITPDWVDTISSPMHEKPKPVKTEPTSSSVVQSKVFECDMCKKTFKRREHMYQHVKLHTGFRPFTCENCNKSFMRKEHLLRHQTSHTGLKNFVCNVCDKSFSRNDNLLKHKKTHEKESNFTCEICHKQFVMKHYYIAHKVTHENDNKCHSNVWNTVKTHS